MTQPIPVLLLFGQPELRLGEQLVALPTRKLMALLAYLALEGPTARSKLAELLWDATDERARANLRGELYRLKKVGLEHALEERGDALVLSGISSDLEVFERAVARGQWQEALEVRRGTLLENFVLPGALEFETWLSLARERLEERFNEVLAARAESLERAGESNAALEMHQRLLSRDALREDSHRAVMHLLLKRHESERALEHYRRHEEFLKLELGLEPSAVLRGLAQAIKTQANLEFNAAPTNLQNPPLVGRDGVWSELEKPSTFALLVGDAGVGKTRLALDYARANGSYLVLPHRELASQVGFGGLIEGLRNRFEAGWRPDNLESIWRLEAARLLPELAMDVGETTTNEARFREGLAQTLFCALGPGGTLVFDDLQWADESTLLFLQYLVRRSKEKNIRLIGTTRPEGLLAGSWLERAMRELERDRLAKRLKLSPLLETDVLALVQALSGSEGGIVFSRRLHAATQGNVFYLLETLRALFERGELSENAGWHTPYDQETSDYLELHLPESVLESVRQRFYRLEELPRRVAELLSLCGRDIAPVTLEKIINGSVVAALETLEQAGLVRVGSQGYRLTHDLSRTALDQGLSLARRMTLHARLCEVLSSENPEPSLAAEIVRHAQASQNWLAARDWGERAAHSAALRYAHFEVAELLAQAIQAHQHLTPDFEREIAMRLEREQALHYAANREAQRLELEQLQALGYKEPSLKPELLFRAGRLAEALGKFDDAVKHYQNSSLKKSKLRLVYALEQTGTLEGAERAALEVYESTEPSDAFEAAILLAELAQERGKSADSEQWLTRAEDLVYGDPTRELRLMRVRARFDYHTGLPERAIEYALQGERLALETGSLLDEAICANTRAVALQSLGQYGKAIPVLEKVRAFATQIEHPMLWSVSTLNLGLLHFQLGDFAIALEITHQITENMHDFGNQIMRNLQLGLIYAYQSDAQKARHHFELVSIDQNIPIWHHATLLYDLGLVNALEGNDLAAVQYLRQEFEISREFNANWVMGAALEAICLLRLGEPQAALERSSAALAALPARGLELPAQQIPWAHAQVLHALGDDAGALQALEQANNLLEQNAQAVGEDARARYLEAFCFNRDIRAALNGIWLETPRLI